MPGTCLAALSPAQDSAVSSGHYKASSVQLNTCSVPYNTCTVSAEQNLVTKYVQYLVKRYVQFVPLRGRPPCSEHDQEEVVDLPEGNLGPHLAEGGGEDEGDDGEHSKDEGDEGCED